MKLNLLIMENYSIWRIQNGGREAAALNQGASTSFTDKGFVGENCILVYEVSDRFSVPFTCSFRFNW